MTRNNPLSEYVIQDDGSEVCRECGHLWSDYGSGHYHDCRYFTLEDESEDDVYEQEDVVLRSRVSQFRPAA